jgi:hypothetical protein
MSGARGLRILGTRHTLSRSTSKPRVVYIHGDGVRYWRWGWVARLHHDLRISGFPTFFELFPDSIDASDVLLGWSCGAVAAMRYAQDHRVGGLVLIAPYFTDLGLDSVRRSGFVGQPWPWARIRRNASAVAIFHSDSDPYVPQQEFAELASRLHAKAFEIPGAGHFADQDTFPELTDHIVQTYG